MSWAVVFSARAKKDARGSLPPDSRPMPNTSSMSWRRILIETHPPYEKLIGDLAGQYSRRINIQHRLVYQVFDDAKVVKVIRMWTHYE